MLSFVGSVPKWPAMNGDGLGDGNVMHVSPGSDTNLITGSAASASASDS